MSCLVKKNESASLPIIDIESIILINGAILIFTYSWKSISIMHTLCVFCDIKCCIETFVLKTCF